MDCAKMDHIEQQTSVIDFTHVKLKRLIPHRERACSSFYCSFEAITHVDM
jgi:hypothetical protein